MPRVIVEPLAWHDLSEIADFLLRSGADPRAVQRLAHEFERESESYAHQPTMGDLQEDLAAHFGEELRSFRFRRSYVAIYRPLSDGIDVLRIFDARSDYQRHFQV